MKNLLTVFFVLFMFDRGFPQEASVLPLVLTQSEGALLDLEVEDYVEVSYFLTPSSEPVFEEQAERVWRIQERQVLVLGATGEPLPAKLTRRAELFVQVFANGQPLWDKPHRVHPQKDVILITGQENQALEALKSSLGKNTGLGAPYLAELANYLAGNLSAIDMTATSYAVEGFGEVIDSTGTWTGNPVESPFWSLNGVTCRSTYPIQILNTDGWRDADLLVANTSEAGGATVRVRSNEHTSILSLEGSHYGEECWGGALQFRAKEASVSAEIKYNMCWDRLDIDQLNGGDIRINTPDDVYISPESGNFGIGTSRPSTRFHLVEDTGNAFAQVQSNNGFAKLVLDGTSDNSTVEFQLNNTYKGSFGYNSDQDYLFLYHGGNVVIKDGKLGVGTTAPQGKLDVNGAIYQRGGVLHADYVFQDDYRLESILEHAEFMWREKHLPAVPAAQTDEKGHEIVEVGRHQRGILEELEKAHIYIGQLHGEVQWLKGQIENLKSMLEKYQQ